MKEFNQNEWYVWEQNASPMLLIMTLNPSYAPLRDYIGICLFNSIIVFEKGQGKWLFRFEEGRVLGQKMVDFLMCPQYKANFEKQLHTARGNLIAKARAIQFAEDVADEVAEFEELEQLFTEYYKLGAFYEPLQWQAEHILSNYVSNDEFKILLTTPEKTFATEISEDLAMIKSMEDAEVHSNKYYWKRNNYSSTYYVSPEEVLAEAQGLNGFETHDKADLLSKKDEIYARLPSYYKGIVDLVNFASVMGDTRKSAVMTANSAFDKLLSIIAKKTSTAVEDVRLLIPQELRYFVENPSEYKERFAMRRNRFLVMQADFALNNDLIETHEGKGVLPMNEPFIAEGSQVDAILNELNSRLNLFMHSEVEKAKLKGVVPYFKEKTIIGKVKVVRNPKLEDISDGDILVAPSTTPDYIAHIHRCRAIITDWGGQTSHAAIVSRELKKPCIIDTKFATSLLKDNDVIEMNFETGVIEVVG